MRKFGLLFALLIFLSVLAANAAALNSKREITHIINESLSVSSHYVDYFYGETAADINYALEFYDKDYDFIITRVPYGFMVDEWAVNSSLDLVEINIWGTYDDYIIGKEGLYKIGGKGFIDSLCTDFPIPVVSAAEQEFYLTVILPQNLDVLTIPESTFADYPNIYYEYEAWQLANELHEYVYMQVKQDADIFDYCVEREKIDLVLKQGFIVTTGLTIPYHIFWISGVLFVAVIIAIIAAITKK